MSQPKSEGHCPFCKKSLAKRTVSRHLETHLAKMPPSAGKQAYHLRIEAGPYFLHVLMNATSSLTVLDSFLRKIWLECCGHLSQFAQGNVWGSEIGKSRKANAIFAKGVKLNYVYDFGTSTELKIQVIGAHPLSAKGIQLLTRNEPLEMFCHSCKKEPAESICPIHWGDAGGWLFCETCSEKHEAVCEDAADYAWMPIVNSPRMGECGYDGGSIDTERDGVFKVKA